MKYWQNEETGMCCAVDVKPSNRHIEITKKMYNEHQYGICPLGGYHEIKSSDYVENYYWCGKCGDRLDNPIPVQ